MGGPTAMFTFGVTFIKFGLVISFPFGTTVDAADSDGYFAVFNEGGHSATKYFRFSTTCIAHGNDECHCCIHREYTLF